MKYLNIAIICVSIIFLGLNYYSFSELSIETTRWVRLLGTFVFLLIACTNKSSRNILCLIIFSLLLVSDFGLIYYENINFKILQFIMRGTAYLLISMYAFSYLRKYRFQTFQKIFILFIVALNFILLYTLADTFQGEIKNMLATILFYFQGTTALIMLALGAIFLSEAGNTVGLVYFLSALGFILSDLAAFSAYHLQYLELFILGRSFYLLAVASFLKYAAYPDKYKILRSSY